MLRERVTSAPDDGSMWTAKKVTRGDRDSTRVGAGRPRSAAGRPCAQSAGRFRVRVCGAHRRRRRKRRRRSKKLGQAVAEEADRHPGAVIEVFAEGGHRLGLKPVLRRVTAT